MCDAAAYAHTRGVIHRDLRPANILAWCGADGTPHVKVIDFGVAKVLDVNGLSVDPQTTTHTGAVLGTLEYMSPEQAAGLPDVDTRSDVFSLGVVLYELLCGRRPVDGRSDGVGTEALRRHVERDDPVRPSQRLFAPGDAAATPVAIAAARSTQPATLAQALRRELEWVPLMARRKDRGRRYATAAALAADVRNYLGGRPPDAGPESGLYRARKWGTRHRRRLVAAAAALLVGVASAGAYVHDIRAALAEAGRQRNEAERQRTLADRRAALAFEDQQSMSQFVSLVTAMGSVGIARVKYDVHNIEQAHQTTIAAYLAVLARPDVRDNPERRVMLLQGEAAVLTAFGRGTEAGPVLDEAISWARRDDVLASKWGGGLLNGLAGLAQLRGRAAASAAYTRESADLARGRVAVGPAALRHSFNDTADLIAAVGRPTEAVQLYGSVVKASSGPDAAADDPDRKHAAQPLATLLAALSPLPSTRP